MGDSEGPGLDRLEAYCVRGGGRIGGTGQDPVDVSSSLGLYDFEGGGGSH